MQVEPRRSLPSRPDLAHQRKLAKELLRAFRNGDPDAIARVRAALPDKPAIGLGDAQFVLAREYGFRSWAEMKRHVETLPRSPATTPEDVIEAARAALGRDDVAALRGLLERHPDLGAMLNEPIFPFDSPVLVHVAPHGDAALVDLLLEFGADPNRRSDWWAGGFHALHVARGDVAERLLAAGAEPDACAAANLDRPELLARMLEEDPSRVHERGGDGQTPLHFARSREVADLLLAAGADIDARDRDHRATPAQWMLDRRRDAGRYALAGYLVDRGATTDIFLAAALGRTERFREMVAADPSLLELRTAQGDYAAKPPSAEHIYTWTIGQHLTALQVAAQFEHPDVLEAIADIATPRQRLLAALAGGDGEAARALVREDPGLLDRLGPADRRALPDAGWAADPGAVALMLELGFDPRVTTSGGATVLHTAAWQGSAACVEIVLRHPAARSLLEVPDAEFGATPLGWCAHGSRHGPRGEHGRVARMLLDAGASPDVGLEDASEEVRSAATFHRRGEKS